MTGNKIKAVIFDMDGVLIDSEMLYLEDLLKFVQTKNPEVTKEDLFGVVGSTAKDTWTIVQDAAANGQDWESLREEYREKRTIYETIDYRSIFRKERFDCVFKGKRIQTGSGVCNQAASGNSGADGKRDRGLL